MTPKDILAALVSESDAPLPPVLMVAPHPDDEVVGAGSCLPQLRDARFVHVTDGSPHDLQDARAHGFSTREAYAAARRREVEAALSLAGIPPHQALSLGCVDQEASLNVAGLATELARLMREFRPAAVITVPYEGGHPDHDATAFAVHAAGLLLQARGEVSPPILEMTSYHNGPAGITVYQFLPCPGCQGCDTAACAPVTRVLSEAQRRFKRRLLDCFATQRQTLSYFPLEVERFRPAPRYDFTQPPHAGQLFYECFSWGMSGERFCRLAAEARETLDIGALA